MALAMAGAHRIGRARAWKSTIYASITRVGDVAVWFFGERASIDTGALVCMCLCVSFMSRVSRGISVRNVPARCMCVC